MKNIEPKQLNLLVKIQLEDYTDDELNELSDLVEFEIWDRASLSDIAEDFFDDDVSFDDTDDYEDFNVNDYVDLPKRNTNDD